MAEDYAVNVDFAILRDVDDKPVKVLAWNDTVRMASKDAKRIEVEVVTWNDDNGIPKPVRSSGFLKRSIRVEGKKREVAVPASDVRVLEVSFVDVQQGDGTLIQTPGKRLITLDGGENQMFARFLASRLRGTSTGERREIDAMIVTHGDADHFAGLTRIQRSETEPDIQDYKRLFVRPARVFHNGLVKRAGGSDREAFGETVTAGGDPVVTDLVTDLLAVPAAAMNAPFRAWRKALQAWSQADPAHPIEFRRLARGADDAFAFLAGEELEVQVLGPIETEVRGTPGLPFLREPRAGVPMAHLDHQSGGLSASHTINGHSIVLRLRFGNVRMLFAGDLNNATEAQLTADHAAGKVDLSAEILKVPHHGSHEFEPAFLKAVSPMVSVVSSGDENSMKEYIHPRATLMSALGRYARDDAALVFVTELAAFFEQAGMVVSEKKPRAKTTPKPFLGFRRTAYGMVRVRTDGQRLLVFTDSGKRDVKEAYAYNAAQLGRLTPTQVSKG